MKSELTAAISAALDAHGITNGALPTAVPGLRLMRAFDRVPPRQMIYKPSLCIVAQGAKQMLAGNTMVTYGEMQSLVITVEAPVLGTILDASAERPFVGANLELDPEIILDVLTRLGDLAERRGKPELGWLVADMNAQISGAIIRLVELSDRPEAVGILQPAIMREIAYWLLTGPAGRNVARMVLPEGRSIRVAKAIHHLRSNFDGTISIAELADIAGMSPSTFHAHFKALTSMSPLQYQKHLRLLDARRRMVNEGENAGAAAHSVGYESVSHFSREYARMFGSPPRREVDREIACRESLAAFRERAGPAALAV